MPYWTSPQISCKIRGLGRKPQIGGKTRRAACIGGMLMVKNGEVRLIATTFEWQEQIDRARAQRALTAAQERLKNRDALTDEEIRLAEAKLRRALVRTSLTETA